MENQRGYIQLLISILVIGFLFIMMVAYLTKITEPVTDKIDLKSPTSTFDLRSPKGIIEDIDKEIEGIQKEKSKELNEFLENLE